MPLVPGHSHDDRIAGQLHLARLLGGPGRTGVPVHSRWATGWRTSRSPVRTACGRSGGTRAPERGPKCRFPVSPGGELVLDVPFEDGPISVVVLSTALPPPSRPARGPLISRTELDGDWEVEACSTLDNRWGDLGDPASRGRFPSRCGDWSTPRERPTGPDRHPTANGVRRSLPTARTCRSGARTRPVPDRRAPGPCSGVTTSSRCPGGSARTRSTSTTSGPRRACPRSSSGGPTCGAGEWVAARAILDLPAGEARTLVVGADADRRVFLDGASRPGLRLRLLDRVPRGRWGWPGRGRDLAAPVAGRPARAARPGPAACLVRGCDGPAPVPAPGVAGTRRRHPGVHDRALHARLHAHCCATASPRPDRDRGPVHDHP